MGPHIIGSYYLSVISIGGNGSLKTHNGKAKFTVIFLNTYGPLFNKNFIISIPTAPTTIAVVVAIAGMILPAINFTLKLSTSSI